MSKVESDAGGTVKPKTRVSMAMPCSISVDDICAVAAKKSSSDAHTGDIRSSIFSSSTCDTLHCFHGPAFFFFPFLFSSTMAALSKNLNWLVCAILQ